MERYCDKCEKGVRTAIVTKREAYEVMGERIEVDADVLVCSECGEELFCEELDQKTLVSAYNKYRQKHKLLMPEEIKRIREQYGLSQRGFAQILNWGDKTIHRYENGSIQDKAHNSLLFFLKEPWNMRKYLEENEISISSRKKERLLERVNELEIERRRHLSGAVIEYFLALEPCEENGFKPFDYLKFCAMVSFFAYKTQGLSKQRLTRLLSYSDMMFYRKKGVSISGAQYINFPYGPVPKNYDLLLGMMETEHIIRIDRELCGELEQERIVCENGMKENPLTEGEHQILQRVQEKQAEVFTDSMLDKELRAVGSSIDNGEVFSYAHAEKLPALI